MKTFLVINGKTVTAIERETLSDATTYAQNFCDHSEQPLAVYEVTNFNHYKQKSEVLLQLTSDIEDRVRGMVKAMDVFKLELNAMRDLSKDLVANSKAK